MDDAARGQPQTFAEKLREQTKLMAAASRRVSKLFSQANRAKKDGNYKESERFLEEGSTSLKIIEEAANKFETVHAEELLALEHLIEEKKRGKETDTEPLRTERERT